MASDRVTFLGTVKFAEDCELDFRAYELRRGGRPLKLERIPMEVLLLLIERRGDLVPREEIVQRVWGKDVYLDTDNSINAAIRKIRQVFKDDPEHPRFVQTVTGRGYRFIAPLSEDSATAIAEPPVSKQGSQPPSDNNLIGRKISHYRVVKVVGVGGMGVVYQAEDLKLGRRVALKFLPAELEGDPAALSRLQSEARAASSLDHPNICSIYELDEHDGRHFIAMQYLEGKTLREWIETRSNTAGPLPMDEVLDLTIQVASGLEAAHQQGIIHRDIKPANIFITDCGKAKILDFGVAKVLAETELSSDAGSDHPPTDLSLTRTGASLGTPSYVSPEQVRGEKIDERADIFSLGLVLYEMATGTKAFTGQTPEEIRDSILHHTATPIRQLNPALCPELEKMISRALEKDRGQRYQKASELRLDAQRLRDGLQDPKADGSVRLKFKYLAVAVAVLALFAPVSYLLIHTQRQHTAAVSGAVSGRRSVAVLGFRNLSGDANTEWLSSALADMFATELAAGQKIRVVPEESVARMRGDLSLPTADSFARETLARIRQHSNVDLVVLGSYLAQEDASGGKVRLDLKLQDTRTGETVATLSRDGSKEDLADLVSLSGASLRRTLGVDSLSEKEAGSVRAATPSNPEATRLYAEGLSKLQKFDAVGARSSLEQAIAADPKHALSHAALAKAFSQLGYDAKATAEAKRALDLSDDLPRADRLLIEGRYRELTHDLPAAIEIYRTLHNFFPDDLQYALLLASAQTNAGLGKDALQTVSQMRGLPSPDNHDAQIDLAEAHAAQSLGDLKLCDRAATAAASRAEQQGSKLILSAALNTRSWSLSRMGKEAEGDAAQAKALALAKETGNPRAVASVQHGMAISQYNQGKFADAQRSFLAALQEFRDIGDVNSTASVSHNLGVLLNDEGDLASARKYLEEALRIQREINDDRGVAADLDDLGSVLESMGNLSQALRMKSEAVQIFHRTGDRRGEAITLGNMGAIQIKQGNIADARASYEKSLALKQQNGDSRGQAYALLGLSFVNIAGDRLDEARSQAERALAIRREMKDAMRGAEAQTQLAEIALEKNRPAEAESMARAAVGVLEKSKVPSSAAYCNVILARALLAQNKIQDADSVSKTAVVLAQQANDFATRADATLVRAAVLAHLGQTSDAFATLHSLDRDAATHGFLNAALRTRLHLGVLEASSPASKKDGVARLRQLRDDAQGKGLLLISRQASTALESAEPTTRIQARK